MAFQINIYAEKHNYYSKVITMDRTCIYLNSNPGVLNLNEILVLLDYHAMCKHIKR